MSELYHKVVQHNVPVIILYKVSKTHVRSDLTWVYI